MAPCENNVPFGGHFGPFAGMGRPPFGCPFRGGDSPDHHSYKPRFGPFGWYRFDRSPERHCRREPELPRWGPFEQGHRRCCRRGPSECNCCGTHSRGCRHERGCHSPGTNRPHPWFGRNADQHCCGRRDQSRCCEDSCRRRCEGSSHRFNCCRHAPCCDQRRQCRCEGRSRNAHCDNCCEFEPCCDGNRDNCDRDDDLDRTDDEPANERDNKIRLVILWLLRELLRKTIKGRHITDSNMDIIIISTPALQRSLGLDMESRHEEN